MKHLSFRVLVLCILMPPLFFIATLETIQEVYINRHLEQSLAFGLQDVSIGDTRPLLEGTARLKDVVSRNVRAYLDRQLILKLGVKSRVAVVTKKGKVLYPPLFEADEDLIGLDPLRVAGRNMNLLDEGILVNVDLELGYNSLLAFLILALYISISSGVLYAYFRAGVRRSHLEAQEKEEEIRRLEELGAQHKQRLLSLESDREGLTADMERIRGKLEQEKTRALANEEEMVGEIVKLEERLRENISLQEEQKVEIAALIEKIQEFEKGRSRDEKTRKKETGHYQKRFKALYKQVIIHDRALDGYSDLTEEMKIGSEEVIRQLNDDPSLVTVKRKVFGKKGRQTVFEIVFAYKGRLYFRKAASGNAEVLVIGTKNTQTRDLEFLNNL